jgi:hypothetical protein
MSQVFPYLIKPILKFDSAVSLDHPTRRSIRMAPWHAGHGYNTNIYNVLHPY